MGQDDSGPNLAPPLRIRTITAGRQLPDLRETGVLDEDLDFLSAARHDFLDEGLEVQTVRIATQPLVGAADARSLSEALSALERIDRQVSDAGTLVAIGPVAHEGGDAASIAGWAAALVRATSNLSFSISVATPENGIDSRALPVAAEVMLALSSAIAGGEANFRFAAGANIPSGTPFFPVAVHEGEPSFSLGLESARLVELAFDGLSDSQIAATRLRQIVEERVEPLVARAETVAKRYSRRFLGIDLSPAPGLDASIALGIEMLTGVPFGSPSTLGACATITRAISSTSLPRCGYSGLMLPVLEDLRLAQRAAEGRFNLNDLLLYSAVCGTGLDVVPIPGEVDPERLAAIVGDVAALAHKLQKPLAVRLLPIPGKVAGEIVRFDNPYLTDATVLAVA
jgi:uncharacterized protein (UPF0210 family)